FPGGNEYRAVGQQRYRFKILEHVVLDRVNRASADMAKPIADAQRIAVRRRTRCAADPDAATRASDVLDHHGLAKRDRQMIGKDTRDWVSDPARRHWHDGGDGARRIGLRPSKARDGWQSGSSRYQMQKSSARKFHCRNSLSGLFIRSPRR